MDTIKIIYERKVEIATVSETVSYRVTEEQYGTIRTNGFEIIDVNGDEHGFLVVNGQKIPGSSSGFKTEMH